MSGRMIVRTTGKEIKKIGRHEGQQKATGGVGKVKGNLRFPP